MNNRSKKISMVWVLILGMGSASSWTAQAGTRISVPHSRDVVLVQHRDGRYRFQGFDKAGNACRKQAFVSEANMSGEDFTRLSILLGNEGFMKALGSGAAVAGTAFVAAVGTVALGIYSAYGIGLGAAGGGASGAVISTKLDGMNPANAYRARDLVHETARNKNLLSGKDAILQIPTKRSCAAIVELSEAVGSLEEEIAQRPSIVELTSKNLQPEGESLASSNVTLSKGATEAR